MMSYRDFMIRSFYKLNPKLQQYQKVPSSYPPHKRTRESDNNMIGNLLKIRAVRITLTVCLFCSLIRLFIVSSNAIEESDLSYIADESCKDRMRERLQLLELMCGVGRRRRR